MTQTPPPDAAALKRRLDRRRGLARAALLWERLWPALWPPLGVAGLFVVLALFGVIGLGPLWLHAAELVLFAVAFGLALRRGFRRFRLPGRAEGERRLERASGLSHRPIAAVADAIAVGRGDPGAETLWRAHLARAAAQLARLRIGRPHPGLPARDPRALRAAVAIGLLAALVQAGADAPQRLLRALSPGLAVARAAEIPVRLDIWVTPPAYTAMAPLFLDPAQGDGETTLLLPAGSVLEAHLTGPVREPALLLGEESSAFEALDAQSYRIRAPITEGDRLAVVQGGREVAAWKLRVQADLPPTVRFNEPPARMEREPRLMISFTAEDDYGVDAVTGELRLVDRPDADPVVLTLPLPSVAPKSIRVGGGHDLSAHPWAGLKVRVRLIARDGAGQTGESETVEAELPERVFNHPVAKALIAIRRELSRAPHERGAATARLSVLMQAPEAFEHDTVVYLAMRVARARLQRDLRAEAVDEVQEILWQTALRLEETGAERAERALQAAREALRQALEAERRGERVDRAEIERLMRELQEAFQRYMEALAEQMERDGAEAVPFDPNARVMDQREINRMMERMRQMAEAGRMDAAREMMRELERMIEALRQGRMARMQSREQAERARQGQGMMGALNDMVQRQGNMMDQSHQRAGGDPAPPQRTRPGQRPGTQPQQPGQQAMPGQGGQDARGQAALRRALGELMQQFGDFTGEVPAPLTEADRAMSEAAQALRRDDFRGAQDAQRRALEALQQGARDAAQQMARQMGPMQPGQQGEDQQQGGGMPGGDQNGQGRERAEGRDPFGRRTQQGHLGQNDGSDVRVPDDMELQRTRDILEELRRRAGERERPPIELDYIDRLLRRF